MKKQRLKVAISAGLIVLGMVGSADAALVGRLAATDGGTDWQAYYDEDADLTWLADANVLVNPVLFDDATNWAANYTVDGVGGWRLPDTLQPDASCDSQIDGASFGFNCTGSEMGNLYYNVLGNTANMDPAEINTGPFSNYTKNWYWSRTGYAHPDYPDMVWAFYMGNGNQGWQGKEPKYNAWAVQSGDVGVVPVPAAVWLFGSGLLGLIGLARRKK